MLCSFREFKYDFSFQSHSETEEGIGEWATQDTVMSTLGIPVLNAALEGRNVSLFAYGQTGSGKSYSMLGMPSLLYFLGGTGCFVAPPEKGELYMS